MAVTASTLVAVESLPASDEVWALGHFLGAAWQQNITVRTAWMTDVAAAKSESEHRRALLGRPYHGCQATLQVLSAADMRHLMGIAQRSGMAGHLFPLYPDQMPLTANAGSGATTLNCDTTKRRVFVGQRIAIANSTNFTVKTVSGKTGSTLTISTTLGANFDAKDSIVFPLIEAKLQLETKGQALTDGVAEIVVDAFESPGPWCLDAMLSPGGVPSGFASYDSLPILHLRTNWSKGVNVAFKRTGSFAQSGIAQVPTVYGSRPRFNVTLPFTCTNRTEWAALAEFFDGRAGRSRAFWLPSPTSDFSLLSHTGSGVTVRAVGPEINWDFWPYIALVAEDGAVQVRTVTGHSRVGDVDTLTLDSVFTPPTKVDRLCVAYKGRFDSDEIVESWITDSVCNVDLPFVELLEEKDITIANLDDPETKPFTLGFEPSLDGGEAGVVVPMFYRPCEALTERPPGRAADLNMPDVLAVRILDEFVADSNFDIESGSVSAELLAALPGSYRLEYAGPVTGIDSSHWHHITVVDSGGVQYSQTTPAVTKHRWQATKTYQNSVNGTETITVRFEAEWVTNRTTNLGAWGVLFNVYVFSTEVNKDYVDGTPFASNPETVSFDMDDPAVWSTVNEVKYGHPKMLICASVPTSYTAACGNNGSTGCAEPGTINCPTVANTAPWLPSADATKAHGNIAFGSPYSGTDFAAVTLGGGCPTSELFEFLIIENKAGNGTTALKPSRSGWNEATGDLDITGGSSMILASCLPSQTDQIIDCCESNTTAPFAVGGGSPECWRAPEGATSCETDAEVPAKSSRCCFPMTSTVTLKVRQRAIKRTVNYVSEVPSTPCQEYSVAEEREIEYLLTACAASFQFGGSQDQREMEWSTTYRKPDYAFDNLVEPFTTPAYTWDQLEGTWTFNTGTAIGDEDPPETDDYYNVIAVENSAGPHVYLDLDIQVEILNDTPSGFAVRTGTSSPLTGYAFFVDQADQTLSIYRHKDEGAGVVQTLLGSKQLAASITAPYFLKARIRGQRLECWMNDDEEGSKVVVDDCGITGYGHVALIGVASPGQGVEFDNFRVDDAAPDGYGRVRAFYNDTGWHAHVPTSAMPLYAESLPGGLYYNDPGDDCGTPGNPTCTKLTYQLLPDQFFYADASSTSANYLGGGKPYDGHGGPECNEPVINCPPAPGDPELAVQYPDWKSLEVRVSGVCMVACPDGSINHCNGFELYTSGPCTVAP